MTRSAVSVSRRRGAASQRQRGVHSRIRPEKVEMTKAQEESLNRPPRQGARDPPYDQRNHRSDEKRLSRMINLGHVFELVMLDCRTRRDEQVVNQYEQSLSRAAQGDLRSVELMGEPIRAQIPRPELDSPSRSRP